MKQGKNPAQPFGARARRLGCAAMRPSRALPCVASRAYRLSRRVAGALLLSLALSGCTHKLVWTPPSALAPVDLESIPEPAQQSTIAALPPPEWDAPETETTEPPRRPVRRRPSPPSARDSATAQPPTQSAGPEIAELAIGSLSSGDDATPQAQQEARDLIGAIQKRVAALPRSAASQQKTPLRQVTSFLKQAQQALNSGDAAGAVTLATKARLIMDDIEKR